MLLFEKKEIAQSVRMEISLGLLVKKTEGIAREAAATCGAATTLILAAAAFALTNEGRETTGLIAGMTGGAVVLPWSMLKSKAAHRDAALLALCSTGVIWVLALLCGYGVLISEAFDASSSARLMGGASGAAAAWLLWKEKGRMRLLMAGGVSGLAFAESLLSTKETSEQFVATHRGMMWTGLLEEGEGAWPPGKDWPWGGTAAEAALSVGRVGMAARAVREGSKVSQSALVQECLSTIDGIGGTATEDQIKLGRMVGGIFAKMGVNEKSEKLIERLERLADKEEEEWAPARAAVLVGAGVRTNKTGKKFMTIFPELEAEVLGESSLEEKVAKKDEKRERRRL